MGEIVNVGCLGDVDSVCSCPISFMEKFLESSWMNDYRTLGFLLVIMRSSTYITKYIVFVS